MGVASLLPAERVSHCAVFGCCVQAMEGAEGRTVASNARVIPSTSCVTCLLRALKQIKDVRSECW
jgi:hypothetical protein